MVSLPSTTASGIALLAAATVSLSGVPQDVSEEHQDQGIVAQALLTANDFDASLFDVKNRINEFVLAGLRGYEVVDGNSSAIQELIGTASTETFLTPENEAAIEALHAYYGHLQSAGIAEWSPEEAQRVIGDADRATSELLSIGLRQQRDVFGWAAWDAHSDSLSERAREELADAGFRTWLFQLGLDHVVDQTDLGLRSSLDVGTLVHVAGLGKYVTAIYRWSGKGDPANATHIGTGFCYDGRVITAAHVVAPVARQDNGELDYSSIRVVFANADGAFWANSQWAFEIDSSRSHIHPAWDVAQLSIRIDEAAAASRRDVSRRLAGVSDAELEDTDLSRGTTFMLTTQQVAGAVRITFVQPGPIVLPARVEVDGYADLHETADPGFLRAFRFEVIAYAFDRDLIGTIRTLSELPIQAYSALTSLTDGTPGYVPVSSGSEIRRLRFTPTHHALLAKLFTTPNAQRLSIEVFGSDLETVGSMSGSPVFLSKNRRPVLAGVHSAGTAGGSARAILPHSRDIALAVPFHRVRSVLHSAPK